MSKKNNGLENKKKAGSHYNYYNEKYSSHNLMLAKSSLLSY